MKKVATKTEELEAQQKQCGETSRLKALQLEQQKQAELFHRLQPRLPTIESNRYWGEL